MSVGRNIQSRKWQLTIQNPGERGFLHSNIKEILAGMKPLRYYCMSDEKGKTFHTHVYLHFDKPVRESTIDNAFSNVHREICKGSALQNRSYIAKEGKWENDEKHGTKIEGTFEEWGSIPEERPGQRTDLEMAYECLLDGHNVQEIIHRNPNMIKYRHHLEETHQSLIEEQFQDTFRLIDTTYISGKTRYGKTRYVMEQYGYKNVCRVMGFGNGPFDGYKGQDVMLFDEFASSFRIQEMNFILEGYPFALPCRFSDKEACYTKVYIISNMPLESQYTNTKKYRPDVWDAFIARIKNVMIFYAPGKYNIYPTAEYLASKGISLGSPEIAQGDEWGDLP